MKQVDLTLYGCPMHYIKAREAIKEIKLEESIALLVNNGGAVDEVVKSLRQDGQECEVSGNDVLTSLIRVKRKK